MYVLLLQVPIVFWYSSVMMDAVRSHAESLPQRAFQLVLAELTRFDSCRIVAGVSDNAEILDSSNRLFL